MENVKVKRPRTKMKELLKRHYKNGGVVYACQRRDFANEVDYVLVNNTDADLTEWSSTKEKYRNYKILETSKEAYEAIRDFYNVVDASTCYGGMGYVAPDILFMNIEDFVSAYYNL